MQAPATAASAASPAALRLFVGLMAPPSVRDAVAAWQGGWQWPARAALAPPAGWHITLAFLGQVPEALLPPLRQALGQVAFEPLQLRLGEPEVWPRGIAVVRPAPNAALDALRGRVVDAVQALGLPPPEAAWKPHLTLARKAMGAVPPASPLRANWAVGDFCLVWSRPAALGPVAADGSRYEVLARWA